MAGRKRLDGSYGDKRSKRSNRSVVSIDDEDTIDKFVGAIRKLKRTQSKLVKEMGMAIIPQKVSSVVHTVSRNIGKDRDLVPVEYDEMEEPPGVYLVTSDYESFFSTTPVDVDDDDELDAIEQHVEIDIEEDVGVDAGKRRGSKKKKARKKKKSEESSEFIGEFIEEDQPSTSEKKRRRPKKIDF